MIETLFFVHFLLCFHAFMRDFVKGFGEIITLQRIHVTEMGL